MRVFVLAICLVLLVAGCGDGELTMSEYAAEVERLITTMNEKVDALDNEALSQPLTIDGTRDFWTSKVVARQQLVAGLEAIEPPEEAAEMHTSAIGIVSRLTAADEGVAELIGTMETEQELGLLYESPEFLATEAVDETAVALCQAAQAEFDSTSDREVFGDVPWIPSELKEVVIVFFGCSKEDRGIAP